MRNIYSLEQQTKSRFRYVEKTNLATGRISVTGFDFIILLCGSGKKTYSACEKFHTHSEIYIEINDDMFAISTSWTIVMTVLSRHLIRMSGNPDRNV
jgi:hypothetical protein